MVPDDRTIVIERSRDELGDWRVCVLTPFGSRIHIPWAMAVGSAHSSRGRSGRRDTLGRRWVRPALCGYGYAAGSRLVPGRVGRSHGPGAAPAWLDGPVRRPFSRGAGRALLLPRRRPDARSPLWQLRKRSYDLLNVASRYPSFPLLLEAYRECLRDVFDMPALLGTLRAIEQRQLRVHVVETRKPSPFASSLLFSYVSNFIYDGDAPLAERRAQALTVDQDQLREILGEADLRELLDADVIAEVEQAAQCVAENYRARSADGIHDLCLRLGDLSREELAARVATPDLLDQVDRLVRARRLLELRIAGERRLIAAEDAARYRDGLGIPLPPGLAGSLLEPVAHPVLELVRRYGRTHGPFTVRDTADRFALDAPAVENVLRQLAIEGRVLEGGFRPGGLHREWCDAEILRQIRRKSLARLRREVEPVEQHTLARFLTHWQGLVNPRRMSHGHLDVLLDAIENLQGAPIPASLLESAVLPARVAGYEPGGLDTLIAAGEVTWAGVEPVGNATGASRFTSPTSYRCSCRCGRLGARTQFQIRSRSPSASRNCWRCSRRAGRASSIRCTRPWAAGILASRSMRSGAWCGAGWSPTIRSIRCARTLRSRRRHERSDGSRREPCSVRGARHRRPHRDAGRCCRCARRGTHE